MKRLRYGLSGSFRIGENSLSNLEILEYKATGLLKMDTDRE